MYLLYCIGNNIWVGSVLWHQSLAWSGLPTLIGQPKLQNTIFFTTGVGNPGLEVTLKIYDRVTNPGRQILYKRPTGFGDPSQDVGSDNTAYFDQVCQPGLKIHGKKYNARPGLATPAETLAAIADVALT